MKRAWLLALFLMVFAVPVSASIRIVPLDFSPSTTIDTLSQYTADSTVCIPTYGAARMTLTLKPSAIGGANLRVAVLVKSCGDSLVQQGIAGVVTADTSNTAILPFHDFSSGTSTLTVQDSTLLIVPGPVAQELPMPGMETTVTWNTEGAGRWGTTRAAVVRLSDMNTGDPFLAREIQIRLRVLSSPGLANPVAFKGWLTLWIPD